MTEGASPARRTASMAALRAAFTGANASVQVSSIVPHVQKALALSGGRSSTAWSSALARTV